MTKVLLHYILQRNFRESYKKKVEFAYIPSLRQFQTFPLLEVIALLGINNNTLSENQTLSCILPNDTPTADFFIVRTRLSVFSL
jgi:hypothetical protein